jgi:SAM-dependent methyltransferase
VPLYIIPQIDTLPIKNILSQNEAAAMTYADKLAMKSWGKYVIDFEQDAILKALKLAGRPTQALDWGCGSGRWSKLLAGLGWQVTCVDVDEHSLEVCRRNVPGAVHILTDRSARTVDCPEKSVDLLLCIEVGPVIETDWYLAEANRVLRPGGLLFNVWWNKYSWRGLACRLKCKLTGNKNGKYYYNFSFWEQKRRLREQGFKLCAAEGFCWSPFGRASDSRWVPFFVQLERLLGLNRCVAFSPWLAVIARKAE